MGSGGKGREGAIKGARKPVDGRFPPYGRSTPPISGGDATARITHPPLAG
jgi:hypothetical protein